MQIKTPDATRNCNNDQICKVNGHCEEYHYKPGAFAFAGPPEYRATIYKKIPDEDTHTCICDEEWATTIADINANNGMGGAVDRICKLNGKGDREYTYADGCVAKNYHQGITWADISDV